MAMKDGQWIGFFFSRRVAWTDNRKLEWVPLRVKLRGHEQADTLLEYRS